MERFGFDDPQADAIVKLQLGRLAGLEILKINEELGQLRASIENYKDILSNDAHTMEIVKTDLTALADEVDLVHASGAGRGFAQSGGVAKAVADKIKEWHPDMDVKIASAQGLAECKKLLMLAKAGKYNGYLLEGMGCPGGCIGGAGTIADPTRTAVALNKYVKDAPFQDPEQSPFMTSIHVLKDDPNFEV